MSRLGKRGRESVGMISTLGPRSRLPGAHRACSLSNCRQEALQGPSVWHSSHDGVVSAETPLVCAPQRSSRPSTRSVVPREFSTLALAWLLAWLLLLPTLAASAEEVVFLVRHAERVDESDAAVLNKAGLERAERLAALLERSGITHIITSDRTRTRQTAAPLARRIRVAPIEVEKGSTDLVLEKIRGLSKEARILVVGHSSILPDLLSHFGAGEMNPFGDYSDLYVLVRAAEQDRQTIIRLRY